MLLRALLLVGAAVAALANTSPCVNSIAGGLTTDSRTAVYFAVSLDEDGTILYGDDVYVGALLQDGTPTMLAGGGSQIYIPPGGLLGNKLSFSEVRGLAYDTKRSRLYISDISYNRILSMDIGSGMVDVLAGPRNGEAGCAGDNDSPMSEARFYYPQAIKLDRKRDILYVADRSNHVVRAINLAAGTVNVIAGTAEVYGHSGDGGPARQAEIASPCGIDVDIRTGTVYFTERAGQTVRKVTMDGIIETIVGKFEVGEGSDGDGGLGVDATLKFPTGLTFMPDTGDLLISDSTASVIRILYANGTIDRYVGFPGRSGYSGDGGHYSAALLSKPWSTSYDAVGKRLIIADMDNAVVRAIDENGIITTLTRLPTVVSDEATVNGTKRHPASELNVNKPFGTVIDCTDDSIYILDSNNHVLRRIDRDTLTYVVAGAHSESGYAGDGGPGVDARFDTPRGLAFDRVRRWMFISDTYNNAIRVVRLNDTVVNTVLGNPAVDHDGGDGGLAVDATTSRPYSIAVDAEGGRLFFVSMDTYSIRVIDYAGTGVVVTLAGSETSNGFQNGPPLEALFESISGLDYDPTTEVLYIGDTANYLVRGLKVPRDPAEPVGNVTTVAGNASSPFQLSDGNGMQATEVNLDLISTLTVDYARQLLYVIDDGVIGLHKIDLRTGRYHVVGGMRGVATTNDAVDPMTVSFEYFYSMATDCRNGIVAAQASSIRHFVNINGKSDGIACPRGYSCPCGRQPLPCKDPYTFCPPDSIVPLNVSNGFLPVMLRPEEIVGLERGYGTQTACPRGSYCSHGSQYKCPTGTYGRLSRQVTAETGCVKCPAGTYQPYEGVSLADRTSLPQTVCKACPPGTYAATSGTRYCSLCPANTAGTTSGASSPSAACSLCPAKTWAPPGSRACIPMFSTDSVAADQDSVNFQRIVPFSANDDGFSNDATAIAATLVVIFFIPLFTVLLVRFGPRRLRTAWNRFIARFDETGLAHPLKAGEVPVNIPTSIGGGFTIFFVGVFLALAGIMVQEYRVTYQVTESLLPLSFGDVRTMVIVPPHYMEPTKFSLDDIAPGMRSGFMLKVEATGTDCAAFSDHFLDIYSGTLKISSEYDESTGSATHVFYCPDCIVSARSELAVWFPPACNTFLVTATTVGAWGGVGSSAYFLPNSTAVELSFLLGMELVQDTIGGTATPPYDVYVGGLSSRGWRLSPGVVSPRADSDTTTFGGATRTPTLLVSLPLDTVYTSVQLEPSSSGVQLLSNVVGLSTVLALPRLVISIIFRIRKFRENKKKAKQVYPSLHALRSLGLTSATLHAFEEPEEPSDAESDALSAFWGFKRRSAAATGKNLPEAPPKLDSVREEDEEDDDDDDEDEKAKAAKAKKKKGRFATATASGSSSSGSFNASAFFGNVPPPPPSEQRADYLRSRDPDAELAYVKAVSPPAPATEEAASPSCGGAAAASGGSGAPAPSTDAAADAGYPVKPSFRSPAGPGGGGSGGAGRFAPPILFSVSESGTSSSMAAAVASASSTSGSDALPPGIPGVPSDTSRSSGGGGTAATAGTGLEDAEMLDELLQSGGGAPMGIGEPGPKAQPPPIKVEEPLPPLSSRSAAASSSSSRGFGLERALHDDAPLASTPSASSSSLSTSPRATSISMPPIERRPGPSPGAALGDGLGSFRSGLGRVRPRLDLGGSLPE